MTREETIQYWEQFDAEIDDIYDTASEEERTVLEEQRKMVEFTISALRQQECVGDVNKSLTLEELRQMDGEPVWCEIYIKGQPSFYGIVHGENVTGFIPGDDKPANLAITNVGAYGLAWLAYRQKPEEGTV